MEYIIVQAGGKGTRLEHLTKNKPKALVPVDNLPMLLHLFHMYPNKKFIIIADYHKEVLRKYLSSFADVKYLVVDAQGTGTASGVKKATELIPDNEPFMLVWSDLILPVGFELPEGYKDGTSADVIDNYVGISSTFPCRWKYENGEFAEERSTEHGVAGFFLFKDKNQLADVPESGELVRWMQQQGMKYSEISLTGTREFGILKEYEALNVSKCRPFNKVSINGDKFIKEPIDMQGEKLAQRERAWYDKARSMGIEVLPKIYSTQPLTMELISGKNIYECDLNKTQKRLILEKLVDALKKLHAKENHPTDYFSMYEAYYGKTLDRLSKVQNMIPLADERAITINGRKCRNVFFHLEDLEKRVEALKCDHFSFIHGDCTFSNLMVRDNGDPVLIDPRGYFGYTQLYGDANYDWAKLYYSIAGNYDRFNLKDFDLDIGGHSIYSEYTEDSKPKLDAGEVKLSIRSNNWEDMEADFFELTGADKYEIKLLHAIIWLSLTTYAWQDYDSICGAFYNGLYYLEEIL
ncbi:sugar phosphate nucleotidyltransferase [Butyrivibrio fibrisolvens]|uniref:sugar phosphate nucleotidyltransferase n=1 Tax=Butyrivibrio fibrisolvens TaxID=831 RepID=UPI0003B7358F|nr:sugar phosphate nucleotidyltransferase [Butyrivibrio fibrisolvens]